VVTQVLQRDTSSNGASSSGGSSSPASKAAAAAIQHNVLRPGTLSNIDSGIADVAYWDLLSHPDIDESISRAKSASDAAVLRRKGHLKEQVCFGEAAECSCVCRSKCLLPALA
jgi:IMP and pyridine-specific 5'-nucleotidase